MAATPSPLSIHLPCGEGPPAHDTPARYVLAFHTSRSIRPADGLDDHLHPLCGHPACEHAAVRSTPVDAVCEPVRALTLDDLAVLGYKADVTGAAA